MKKKQDNAVITVKEALELLAPHQSGRKKRVHTFQACSIALLGCDMDLSQIKDKLKAAFETDDTNVRLSGDNMRAMGHGVAFFDGKTWTFLATDKYKLSQKLISIGCIESVIPKNTRIKGEKKFGRTK